MLRPAPRPASPQAGKISQPGTSGCATSAVSAAPVATNPKPARISRTRRSGPSSAWSRPCHHDPPDHSSPDTTSGRPAAIAPKPCCTDIVRGTIDSTPNSDPASSPRMAIGAATPRRTRAVPGGSSVRSPQTRATAPSRAASTDTADGCCPAASSAATPTATARACRMRFGPAARLADAAGPANPRSTGTISKAPTTTNGTSPRNAHRQLACWARAPATTGPSSAGTTQADDIAAKTRGRNCSGYAPPSTT